MCLVIYEGRKNGGRGWADYDTLFRQHAAAADQDPTMVPLDWSRLEPSLHSSCLVGMREPDGQLCINCGGSDHGARACALQALEKGPASNTTQPTPARSKARTIAQSTPICIQWNRGECRHDSCRYRHTCATCPGQHRACDCPTTSKDSFYKRAAGRVVSTALSARDSTAQPN